MTLPGWVYFVGVLVLWRVFAGVFYRLLSGGDDWRAFTALVLGAIGAFIWPVAVTIWLGYRVQQRWPDAMFALFFHTPSHERKMRRRARLQAEIDRLERDVLADDVAPVVPETRGRLPWCTCAHCRDDSRRRRPV